MTVQRRSACFFFMGKLRYGSARDPVKSDGVRSVTLFGAGGLNDHGLGE